MQEGALKRLREIVGESNVSTDKAQVLNYVFDETPIPLRPDPTEDLVIVKPIATEQVAAVMNLANDYHIPVFPRGRGTGLVAGAISQQLG